MENNIKDKKEKILRDLADYLESLKEKYKIQEEDFNKIMVFIIEFILASQGIEITEELIEMVKKDFKELFLNGRR